MGRIGEAVPHVELPVVISSQAATDLNVALAVERQHGIGPCPKASRRQSQLHDVRIVPLVHARGDHVFARTHWAANVVIPCGATPGGPGQARSALRLLAVIARIAYIVAEVALLAAPSL